MASFELSVNELRVLGVLLEKQVTTPEQYPLTLKAIVSACNQKSSRDPVMSLDEGTVEEIIAGLEKKYLVSKRTEYGSRVNKHRQRFCNTEFGKLQFTPGEFAVVCGLMLRGPQTPGELRNRLLRMHPFEDVNEVDETLSGLMTREDGPFVTRLEREPGRRESRFAHLLGSDKVENADTRPTVRAAVAATVAQSDGDAVSAHDADRIERLERAIEALAVRVDELTEKIGVREQSD